MNFFSFILLLLGIGAFAFFVIHSIENRRLIRESLNFVLLRVALPKEIKPPEEKEHEPKFRAEISRFEQLLGSLSGFRHPITIELAVHHVGEEIHFYFAVNRREREVLERQIQGLWPDAEIELTEDYNIFNPDGESIASGALLRKHFSLPLRMYDTMDADPFAALTNALSKLEKEGEGAAVQVILKKAPQDYVKKLSFILEEMRSGKRFEEAVQSSKFLQLAKLFGKAAVGKPLYEAEKKADKQPPPIDQETVSLLEKKLAKPLYYVNLRLVTSAGTKDRASNLMDQIERTMGQYEEAKGNAFRFFRPSGRRKERMIFDYSFRNFRFSEAMVLNARELASLVHLPTHEVGAPRVVWVKARSAAPPINLPSEGIILGKNVYRGEERIIRLHPADRLRHLYIVGQTGTGKSALIREMVRQDIAEGRGVAVIDPHGDLAEALLGLVPSHRVQDVVYFNPPDVERPMGLNLLEYDLNHPEQKTFIINEMIEIMDKLYDLRQTGGPMFEQYMRNSMLLAMGDPIIKATLMEVPMVLADASFRHELLARCDNPAVVHFWTKEAEKAGGEAALANMVPYVTSKLNPFIANEIVRPIIGQVHSSFNAREIMDSGKIFIVNLAKGVLGETNSYLLGMIVVGKLLMAAMSRTDLPEEERRPFYLYIDEFQTVTTRTIAIILSEARKYALGLIIAHQFIGQLREDVRDAVFGNVGTQISFRVGPQDAEFLAKQFAPIFTAHDLINLDNYNAYIKLQIKGQTSPAFNMVTFPPTKPNSEISSAAREYSRLKYGRPREEVEEEIAERFI